VSAIRINQLSGAAAAFMRCAFLFLGLQITHAAHAGLPETIARIKASVIPVGAFNELDNPRFGFRGTGFVVGDGNMLVTNAHVLPEPTEKEPNPKVVVQIPTGRGSTELRPAHIVTVNKSRDLALLRFEGTALPALRLAPAGGAQEGTSIGFMGFPIGGLLGFSPVTHRGIISSITPISLPAPSARQLNERAIKSLRDGSFDILQLDATAYPGNSGGPVFDAETGEVVGVLNMALIKGSRESALSQPSGISYAIPVAFVHELLSVR
jgi:serine protease Do